MALTKVTANVLADDAISYEKIDNEFTTSSAVTGVSGPTGDVYEIDFDAAQIFTFTMGANAGTLNVVNPKIGMTKVIIVNGGGYTMPIDFYLNGSATNGIFYKISGDYDDSATAKNFIQIICVSATEFWYSISQYS